MNYLKQKKFLNIIINIKHRDSWFIKMSIIKQILCSYLYVKYSCMNNENKKRLIIYLINYFTIVIHNYYSCYDSNSNLKKCF